MKVKALCMLMQVGTKAYFAALHHLSARLSIHSRLHSLLQGCIQGILLLDQPFQVAHLALNNADFLLHMHCHRVEVLVLLLSLMAVSKHNMCKHPLNHRGSELAL